MSYMSIPVIEGGTPVLPSISITDKNTFEIPVIIFLTGLLLIIIFE